MAKYKLHTNGNGTCTISATMTRGSDVTILRNTVAAESNAVRQAVEEMAQAFETQRESIRNAHNTTRATALAVGQAGQEN